MPRLREESEEVYYLDASVPSLGPADIEFLIKKAAANPRRRCRICVHDSPSAQLHQMVIVHNNETYVRPHMHPIRPEIYTVLQGRMRITTFGDAGELLCVHPLGEYGAQVPFVFSMQTRQYHSLLVDSDWVVFQEVTTGPFDRSSTVFAPWAPEGDNRFLAEGYMAALRKQADAMAVANN